jgi:predicted transcriptional regulator
MDEYSQPELGDNDSALGSPTSDGEARREALRAAVKRGLEEIEAGHVVDLEAALDRIEAMLDELEAIRRD